MVIYDTVRVFILMKIISQYEKSLQSLLFILGLYMELEFTSVDLGQDTKDIKPETLVKLPADDARYCDIKRGLILNNSWGQFLLLLQRG